MGSSSAWRSAACACLSSRDASRRRRSIARLRAVVMIQPAGLGGITDSGQRCVAVANASATASSAMSRSPKWRVSTATARPYSSRNTAAMSSTVLSAGSDSAIDGRAYLDRQRGRGGDPPRPLERGVEVGRLDQGETTQVLLALDERTVGHQRVTAVVAYDRRDLGRLQSEVEHPRTGRLHLFGQCGQLGHHRVERLGRRWRAVGLIDAEQILRHRASPFTSLARSYVASTTPVVVVSVSTSRSRRECAPNSRRPSPRTIGWIISTYASTRSCSARDLTRSPLPSTPTLPSVSALRQRTWSGTSSPSTVELAHPSGSCSVLDTTYFWVLFSTSVYGLSGWFGQYAAKSSYVRRPSSNAPPSAMPLPISRAMTSSLPATAQPPCSKSPRVSSSPRPGDFMTASRVMCTITVGLSLVWCLRVVKERG